MYFIFTSTKDGKENRFCRAPCCLHWIYTKATKIGEDREALINTVEDNKCIYTHLSYLCVKLDIKLQRIIGRTSIKMLKWIIGSNLLTNCLVNISYVSAAEDIFIPDVGSLCGVKKEPNLNNLCIRT